MIFVCVCVCFQVSHAWKYFEDDIICVQNSWVPTTDSKENNDPFLMAHVIFCEAIQQFERTWEKQQPPKANSGTLPQFDDCKCWWMCWGIILLLCVGGCVFWETSWSFMKFLQYTHQHKEQNGPTWTSVMDPFRSFALMLGNFENFMEFPKLAHINTNPLATIHAQDTT